VFQVNTLRARHASGENAAPVDAMHLEPGIDHGERVLSPVREPADALAADIRAKLGRGGAKPARPREQKWAQGTPRRGAREASGRGP